MTDLSEPSVRLDRFYQSLWSRNPSRESLVTAGWLEDKPTDVDYKLRYYTTPTQILNQHPEKNLSVLFYPGCFAPVHDGHLKTMEYAKHVVETQTGETVAAGYFAADHDNYILRKTNNDYRFITPNRLQLLHQKTQPNPWMLVDPYPALYTPSDLNFTTLYERLEAYLTRWVPGKNIKIYMVFGADNYLFANAFTQHGYGVCIPRAGVSMDLGSVHPDAKTRVLFGNQQPPGLSSTEARAQLPSVNTHPTGTVHLVDDLPAKFAHNATEYQNKLIVEALRILFESHLINPNMPVKVEEYKPWHPTTAPVRVIGGIVEAEQSQDPVLYASDFVLGTTMGGVVGMTHLNTKQKLPAIAPYFNLDLSYVHPTMWRSLNMELWKLNASIYKHVGTTVRDIQDTHDFTLYGFHPDLSLHELAVKHFLLLHR